MQCPKCKHEAESSEFGPDRQCPVCGAYYDKALRYARGEKEPSSEHAPATPSMVDRIQSAQAAAAKNRERKVTLTLIKHWWCE